LKRREKSAKADEKDAKKVARSLRKTLKNQESILEDIKDEEVKAMAERRKELIEYDLGQLQKEEQEKEKENQKKQKEKEEKQRQKMEEREHVRHEMASRTRAATKKARTRWAICSKRTRACSRFWATFT
jgi:hypothetical protein